MIGRFRPAVLATALFAVVAGCAGGSVQSGEVRPITDILESEIVVDVDASATTATLTVDTSIPVACAVIYGIDSNYGSIAVDADMTGGAHNDHSPLLTGLVPDTEYHFILQGSDADGNLYRSGDLTFRTPPAEESSLGTNIAPQGTIAAASSEFSDAFLAVNAIDGDPTTEWSSAGDGDDAYIEIDLGQPNPISAVAFRTRQMSDGTAITDSYTVTIDNGETFGPYPTGTTPTELPEAVTGQVVRIDAHSTTGGNTGAVEIEIYTPK